MYVYYLPPILITLSNNIIFSYFYFLPGASLGLSDVHLAGVVRLVFSPITEDPPFLRRLAISLLNRPYVDFSVRALGGPDLMSLPAISSWLHGAVINLAERAIVWPKEVSVPLGPPPAAEAALAAAAEAAALIPPLGVLVVRVIRADIEPRRSTFLGRLKLPSPRVALVLPETPAGHGGGAADEGVMQAGLTTAQEKTLQPQWNTQFQFVVSRPSQEIRLLLTHRRLDLLAADMPLGAADLPVEDILAEYAAARAAETVPQHRGLPPVRTGREAALKKVSTEPPPRRRRPAPRDETPSPKPTSAGMYTSVTFAASSNSAASGGDEGYASATSSPRCSSRSVSPAPSIGGVGGGGGVVWASPSAGLPRSSSAGGGAPAAAVRTRGSARALAWTASLAQAATLGPNDTLDVESMASMAVAAVEAQGLGLLLRPETSGSSIGATPAPQWTPLAVRPPTTDAETHREGTSATKQTRRTARASPAPPPRGANAGASPGTWLSHEGVWIEIPMSRSMTMAGMVSNAAEAELAAANGGPAAAATAVVPDDAVASGGWLQSMRSMVMRAANLSGHEEEEEGGDSDDERPPAESCAGKVKLALNWLPVASGPPLFDEVSSPYDSVDGDGESATPVVSPRPAPTMGSAGVLAVRVAYTKLDYGDNPINPILSLSIGINPAASMSAVAAAAANAAAPSHRMVCTECQSGGRPGLLHWGRVFHLPVWSPGASRALLELGDAASALKLSTYGAELYALDACADFETDVNVEAAASIPLKDVLAKGVVRGTWRLREARRGAAGGLAAASEAAHEHLDIGRVALVMAWFPLA